MGMYVGIQIIYTKCYENYILHISYVFAFKNDKGKKKEKKKAI